MFLSIVLYINVHSRGTSMAPFPTMYGTVQYIFYAAVTTIKRIFLVFKVLFIGVLGAYGVLFLRRHIGNGFSGTLFAVVL